MQIVNVRGLPPNAPGIIYCGRAYGGWRASPLANHFHLRRNATPLERDACIHAYRVWLCKQIDAGNRAVLDALEALMEDSVLGCWCAPKPCHCDVIVEVWAARHARNAV